MGAWIEIDTPHGPISAWKAFPTAAPRGALVVIQEIFGVNAHIRSVADDFAGQGYAVLAPALFDVLEPGVELDYDAEGIARGRDLITRLGLEKALDMTASAAAALAGHGKVGTVGYCWGGTVALLAALRLGLPSASYYGARNVPFLGETPKAPVIFHFGERDASIPPEMVEKHRQLLPQMPLYVYPAGHGFNCDARADFEPQSAALARSRTLAFFDEQLR
ncbi:dienelactone hydrolase family protein [Pseudoxanthomonas sacheonensis]|uniref:dienelactone hydrolase family protein n=1 Tax=Pseudoxanthomonas sacheonensis TaxID=443615 RepID=UPI0013D48279|nr:dienelactone hydrolase family protein [Pseudoxanthomonas sacheonensis]KAF1707305.1 carboxymethylenebutenolidase [Pseudoxanthomonas sacheonensis]